MKWFHKYAPGFMCVGRKPHLFSNEIHTVCCGLISIFLRPQIVEGKDHPKNIGHKEYNDIGKMVSIMLSMCIPIFGSWEAVVFDNLFCVAKGIT